MQYFNHQQEIQILIEHEKYEAAIAVVEAVLNDQSAGEKNHWYLGLIYLLGGQEDEAQNCWTEGILEHFTNFTDGVEALTLFLKEQALRLAEINQKNQALRIWEQILILNSDDLASHLNWINLADELNQFSIEQLAQLETIELVNAQQENVDEVLLLEATLKIL